MRCLVILCALLFMSNLFGGPAFAQKIEPDEIEKILLINHFMTSHGDTINTVEVKKSGKYWLSTQVGLRVEPRIVGQPTLLVKKKSVFIDTITSDLLDNFLSAVNDPHQTSLSESLGIGGLFLKEKFDSLMSKPDTTMLVGVTLESIPKDTLKKLKAGLTDKKVDRAIAKELQYENIIATDLTDINEIEIVKKNADTIEMSSSDMNPLALPWRTANGDLIYNINISRFYFEAFSRRPPNVKFPDINIDSHYIRKLYLIIYLQDFLHDY